MSRLAAIAAAAIVVVAAAQVSAEEPAAAVSAEGPAAAGAASAAAATAPARELSFVEIAEAATPSVVLLAVYDGAGNEAGTGTGFVIGDGRVATNHHVIAKASRVVARFPNGGDLAVEGILADDPSKDLAIIKLARGGQTPLRLAEPPGIKVGEEIAVIGSPLGLSTTLLTGIVAAIRQGGIEPDSAEVVTSAWALHITAPTAPGSSGSPILSRRGEVVGVVVGGRSNTPGMHFGILVADLHALIARMEPSPRPFSAAPTWARSTRVRDLAISAALIVVLVIAYRLWSARDDRPTSTSRKSPRRGRDLES